MRTEYLGACEVRAGYNGHMVVVHLCYDPESLKTLEIIPEGFYNSAIPPAVDSAEAKWLINHHPNCKRYRI